jgi:glycerol kinase
MTSVLALDQGTTGSTALVVASDGRLLGRGYRELPQHYPAPGEVEHDAEDILRVTLEAARDALRQAGGGGGGGVVPATIGITNQRETVCVWERGTGRPLHRAIVWQDRRTAPRCAQLAAQGKAALIRRRCGLVLDPYFSATKIEWLLEHVPGLERRMRAGEAVFGTVDAWLLFRLTNGRSFATDHTNASRTMLYDINRRAWDDDLLRLFGVAGNALPEIRPSSGTFGVCDGAYFGTEIPITGMAGDQQAALFGQGCWTAGSAKNTYGTGAFLLLNTGGTRADSKRGLLTTVACGRRGEPVFALEGSVFIAGAAIQWLRDGLGLIRHAAETAQLARDVPDTGGVYFVPAFVGIGAPHWEPGARGTIVGLTRGTGRAHVARAALEAMAFSTLDVLEAMTADAKLSLRALQVDGGAAANDWLMQFQADLLGVPVARPDLLETTALGAAGLAGLGAGVWTSPEEFLAGRVFTRFAPGSGGRAVRSRVPEWRRAVGAALHWAAAQGAGGQGGEGAGRRKKARPARVRRRP